MSKVYHYSFHIDRIEGGEWAVVGSAESIIRVLEGMLKEMGAEINALVAETEQKEVAANTTAAVNTELESALHLIEQIDAINITGPGDIDKVRELVDEFYHKAAKEGVPHA